MVLLLAQPRAGLVCATLAPTAAASTRRNLHLHCCSGAKPKQSHDTKVRAVMQV